MAQFCEYTKNIELYTLIGWIICYVNYISVKIKNKVTIIKNWYWQNREINATESSKIAMNMYGNLVCDKVACIKEKTSALRKNILMCLLSLHATLLTQNTGSHQVCVDFPAPSNSATPATCPTIENTHTHTDTHTHTHTHTHTLRGQLQVFLTTRL